MNLKELILERRSVRKYKKKAICEETIQNILETGIWAPSGLNNQPWRFKIITEPIIKNKLAQLTKYNSIIEKAPCVICVFLEKEVMYDRDKDIMAIGACIQNMLLYAFSIGIGSCWLGEILNKKDQANKLLGIKNQLELMAVIAFGYDQLNEFKLRKGQRDNLESFILK
ncbi:MAG: nitroreductase family protein [Candidatus Omnitrophota bacterium]